MTETIDDGVEQLRGQLDSLKAAQGLCRQQAQAALAQAYVPAIDPRIELALQRMFNAEQEFSYYATMEGNDERRQWNMERIMRQHHEAALLVEQLRGR
jgi:hypothetical protein